MLPTNPGGRAPGSATGPEGPAWHKHSQAEPLSNPQGGQADELSTGDRHRLSWYGERGLMPQGIAPSSIAAAHVRLTGRQPARDPERRHYKAYSPLELLAALAELSRSAQPPAPPTPRAPQPPPAPQRQADPMADIWARALLALQLPSTRMLLSQQARLLELRRSRYPQAPGELLALVEVEGHWLPMVASRRHLVAQALADVLGVPACVALIAASDVEGLQ